MPPIVLMGEVTNSSQGPMDRLCGWGVPPRQNHTLFILKPFEQFRFKMRHLESVHHDLITNDKNNKTIMKSTKILSGKFANGEGQKGNFTGYNASGKRIFIHKAQMEAIGMKEDKDFKPFFALVDEREIQTRDANGELTDVLVKRLQALSCFKTEAELVDAVNADAKIDIAIALDLKATASTAGLTESQVNSLLASAI